MTSETVRKIRQTAYTTIITIAIIMAFEFIQGAFNKSAKAASVEYVDFENTKQNDSNKKAHDALRKDKADKEYVDELKETLKVMDSRIYDLWVEKNKGK